MEKWFTAGDKDISLLKSNFRITLLIMTDSEINKVLIRIGLNRRLLAKEPKFNVFNKTHFIQYVSKEYLQNTELREMDEVYRISEQIILHKETGLRFRYSTHENFNGDEVEYKFIEMFVLNNYNQQLGLIEVNLDSKFIITKEGQYSFDKLSKSEL